MSNGFFKKGCLFQTAFAIVVVYTVFWLIYGINTVNTWPVALASAFVPLGGLILSLYKQHIGGLLIILSGFLPIIILANTPRDDFYNLGMIIIFIFVTLPLLIAGIVIFIAPSKEGRRKLAKIETRTRVKSIEGTGETFNYITNKCPYCNSPTIEGGIIYRASNDEERKTLGFKTKWQRVCLKCKSKWISVEK